MKSSQKITTEFPLPQTIKDRISKNLVGIKELLGGDINYADKTIEKLLTAHKNRVTYDYMDTYMGERYKKIENIMTDQSYNDFVSLSNFVVDLAALINNFTKVTEDEISKRFSSYQDKCENSSQYVEDLRNQICEEIQNQYSVLSGQDNDLNEKVIYE